MRKFKVYTYMESYTIGTGDFSQGYTEPKKYIFVPQDVLYPGDFEDLISWATFFITKEEVLNIASNYEIAYEIENAGEIKELPPRNIQPHFPYKEGMRLYSKDLVGAIRGRVDEIVAARETAENTKEEDDTTKHDPEQVLYEAMFGTKDETKQQGYQLYTFYPAGSGLNIKINPNEKVICFRNSVGRIIGYTIIKATDKRVTINVPDQYKPQIIGKGGSNIKEVSKKYNLNIIIK